MEEDDDEEMQEEEEEDEEEMSGGGYIGAKGPMVRTSLKWIQWMRKHPLARVWETYLDINREKNEEIDRMVWELTLLKKYTDNVDEENTRLRLSGLGPKEHKEAVEKWRGEVETFQEKAQLLTQENADLGDSVHHFAQMVMAGSTKTVGVDKAIQAEPTVTEKEVQTVSRIYGDMLSQTEKEEEKVEVKRGTGTTDDEEIIDALVPKLTKLRPAAKLSQKPNKQHCNWLYRKGFHSTWCGMLRTHGCKNTGG